MPLVQQRYPFKCFFFEPEGCHEHIDHLYQHTSFYRKIQYEYSRANLEVGGVEKLVQDLQKEADSDGKNNLKRGSTGIGRSSKRST